MQATHASVLISCEPYMLSQVPQALVPNLGLASAVLPLFASMYEVTSGVKISVNITSSPDFQTYGAIISATFMNPTASWAPTGWLMINSALGSGVSAGVLMVSCWGALLGTHVGGCSHGELGGPPGHTSMGVSAVYSW